MAYDRVNWENTPSRVTPISAENLNIMDEAIDTLDEEVSRLGTKATNLETRMGAAEEDIDEIGGELTEQDTYAKGVGTRSLQNETDIAVLQGQVAQIISGGSPAGDEVTDIRVAENGTTYNSAGDAVRAQVRQLVTVSDTEPDTPGNKIWIDESGYTSETQVPTWEEFSDLKQDLLNNDGYRSNRYKMTSSQGKWVYSGGYCRVIEVNPNDRIFFVNTNTATYFSVLKTLSGIDVSGTAMDYATGYSATVIVPVNTKKEFVMPSDGHYIYFYADDDGSTFDHYFPNSIYVNDYYISASITENASTLYIIGGHDINVQKYIDTTGLTSGYYVKNSTGALEANSSFNATGYIPIRGKKIGISRGVGQFAFYSVSKKYIGGVAVVSTDHDYVEYDIPTGASYVRLSTGSSQNWNLEKTYYTLTDGESSPFDGWIIVDKNYPDRCPEFKTVRAAVEYAVRFKDQKVLVRTGTYNLLTEFATEIANSQASQYGLGIGNGIHIMCESGTVINALYEGEDTNVFQYFSPFYTLNKDGGFTLENVEIHSSNCRYCVHDEYTGADVIVHNIYKNCKMYHDNTGAGTYADYYPQCIGGGCAKHTYVDIVGCYFKSKKAESSMTSLVSYHNASIANALSHINVSNSYFDDKGTFRVSYYGSSSASNPSKAIINNCSFGNAPYASQEGGGGYPENFILLAFMNEIRT